MRSAPARLQSLHMPPASSLRSTGAPLILLVAFAAGCGTGPSENAGLAEACVVAGAALAATRTTIDLAMERAGQALLYQTPGNRYALLTMPGCQVTQLPDVPERVGVGNMFILPGGTRLFPTSPPGRADLTWWYARNAEAGPARIEFLPDPASPSEPILSSDGAWVAWLRSIRNGDTWRLEVAMRHPDGRDTETIVRLDSLQPDTYELLQLDAGTRELTLARRLNAFVRIGFDGLVRASTTVADIAVQPGTCVGVGGGYFAWDATRDGGPYRIGWSWPAGAGTVSFERLRQIQHAAIDPSGRFAAASLETQHGRLLSLSDAVAVVRLSDRREVFRAYLPRFTRSEVTFLTDGYFAYADPSRVRVVRLPR